MVGGSVDFVGLKKQTVVCDPENQCPGCGGEKK